MKIAKRLLILAATVIMLCVISVVASAATYGDLTYDISDGEASIYGCSSSVTEVEIPAEINGYPVTSIGVNAFIDCTSLTEITIPDSVTSIGHAAFNNTGYYNDESNWENGVLYIGKHLIVAKDDITECEIKDGTLTIGGFAFRNCRSLTEITIPDCVTTISSEAFSGCTSLTEITIPDSVTSIGAGAFIGCTNLQEITIPDSVTSIGNGAFSGCTSLTEITIPDSITSIGYGAFSGCTSLTEITIPDSVTLIGDEAFHGCTNLTEITISDSVTSIGDLAFYGCASLTEITIPDSVILIGSVPFYGTAYFNNESNWEKDALYIGKHLISVKDENITGYEIKDGTLTIGGAAFGECTSLTEITIPESVTSIGNGAFSGCTSLTEISIPDSVTLIGDEAFFNCTSLTEITIPCSVTSIGKCALGYYDAYGIWTELINGFTIYGCAGTAADIYANENSIKFVEIEHEEDVVVPDAPVVDEPVVDEPVVDEPVVDEPTPDTPAQNTPSTLNPNKDSNITVTDTVANLAPEMSIDAFINSVENENVQILDKDGKEIAADEFVGTGAKILVLDNEGNILTQYEVMVKSDVDGNGKITPADARLALRAAAGLDTIEGVYETAANFDDKDTITTSDARMILRKAAGLE